MAARLRKGDLVVVISGKDKGKQGKVARILADDDKVVVEGMNLVKRHTKPTPRNPAGGHRRARAGDLRVQGDAGRSEDRQGDARSLQDGRQGEQGSHRGEERRRDPDARACRS